MTAFDRVIRFNNKVYLECSHQLTFIGRVKAVDSDVVILSDAYMITLGGYEEVIKKGDIRGFLAFYDEIEIERHNLKFATIYRHKFPGEKNPSLVEAFFPEEREG